MILTYSQMEERARSFYATLGVTLTKRDLPLAIQSLAMPEYTKIYNDANRTCPIHDNDSLATVGDAVFYVYVLELCFTPRSSEGFLTDKKAKYCANETMNVYGEEWLRDWLFATHTDLYEEGRELPNRKGYATAFEAVVGFLYLRARDRVEQILCDRYPRAAMEQAYRHARQLDRIRRAGKSYSGN